MFPVAAAAKFSIVVCPFQSPLCVPGNLCHIVRGRAGPTSLIKVLWSASWTSTNKLPYILWWPVYSHTYLNYNHQCHSWVLSVWCQPAWEDKVSVEELPWSGLSVRHFLDDSWYRRALPTVGGAILACTPGLMRNAADQGMEPVSKQPSSWCPLQILPWMPGCGRPANPLFPHQVAFSQCFISVRKSAQALSVHSCTH